MATISFAANVGFWLGPYTMIPYIIIHVICIPLAWWFRNTRSQTQELKNGSSAFFCSYMTVYAIVVSITAWRFFGLFFSSVIINRTDRFIPEMLAKDFGNRLLEEWNITHLTQVDGLQCAAHLRKQRLQSAFFDCGSSAETCGCQFWNRTSNHPVILELYGHLPHINERSSLVAYLLFPDAILLHVVPASFALVIGPFQLNPKFRNKSMRRHKICGYVYSLCVLIAAIGSVYLEAVTVTHFVGNIGLMCVSLCWVFTLTMGVAAIHSFSCDKSKMILSHKRWMMRNYFLTFLGVIFRWYFAPLEVIFGKDITYQILGWIWLPKLILLELYIRRNVVEIGSRDSTLSYPECLNSDEIVSVDPHNSK